MAAADAGFRALLLENPQAFAASLDCSPETLNALQGFTPDKLQQAVGMLAAPMLLPCHPGGIVTIVPHWLDLPAEAGRRIVRLDQEFSGAVIGRNGLSLSHGLAFGSGWHPSTALSILALEQSIKHGMAVLDVGTGTGVLAISAAVLGASCVAAIDLDFQAVRIASRNACLNRMEDKVFCFCGSWQSLYTRNNPPFDLALANLIPAVLEQVLAHGLAALVKPGGTLILSGFRCTDLEMIEQIVTGSGCRVLNQLSKGEWVAITCVREC